MKSLLLAFGILPSIPVGQAQVFSVNAAGQISVQIKRGFNFIGNQLDAGPVGNQMGNLARGLRDVSFPPGGTRIFKFRNDLNRFVDAIADLGEWLPANVAQEIINPGEGFVYYHPGAADLVLTMTGTFSGGSNLQNPLPRGFSIKSNIVPQGGVPQLPAQDADRFFRWDPILQRYLDWIYDSGEWLGAAGPLPSLGVGEAFLYFRANPSVIWTRSFSLQ